jgi:hypothetical protein
MRQIAGNLLQGNFAPLASFAFFQEQDVSAILTKTFEPGLELSYSKKKVCWALPLFPSCRI